MTYLACRHMGLGPGGKKRTTMNGSVLRIGAKAPGAHRAPISAAARVRRFAAAVVITAMTLLGIQASSAWAAAGADITKELDGTQGGGFTAPRTFETGALVRYRITVSCSGNDADCIQAAVTDVLEPYLTFVQVIAPTTTNSLGQTLPITTSTSGQTVTTTIGSVAAPFQGGNTVELVLVAKVTGYPPDGTIDNKANVSFPGWSRDSDVVTINVPKPKPQFSVNKGASPTSIPAGETSTFTINFSAPSLYGGVDITGGTLVDTFPTGAIILDASGNPVAQGGTIDGGVVDYTSHTITWPIGAIPSSKDMNCSAGVCYTYWTHNVTMRFPDPPFTAGQTVTNSATATVTYADGTSGTLTDTASVGIIGVTTGAYLSKGGPAQAVPGELISWSIQDKNTGNATSTMTVTELLPTSGVSGLTLWATYPGTYMPITGVKSPVTFEYQDASGAWQSWFVWNPGDGFPDRLVPSGATAFRATGSLAPGSYFYFQLKATVTGAAGSTFTNCVQHSGTATQPERCVTTTVVDPQTKLLVYKNHILPDSAVSSVAPGEIFTFWVSVKRESGSPLTTLDLADLLPAEFEYLRTKCIYATGSGATPDSTGPGHYAACLESTAVEPIVTPGAAPADPTLLQWLNMPALPGVADGTAWYSIAYEVRAKPGTAVANYTNKFLASNGATDIGTTCGTNYYNYTYTNAADLDSDGTTADTMCGRDDAVQVRLAAAADITKWDKGPLPNALQSTGEPSATCPDWDGFTRFPCVAQTNPGGAFDYRFRIQNTGNMPLTDFVAYDILPFVGDTGVGQLLSGSSRSTEWSPVLNGPIAIENQPSAAATEVLYNLTSNPCRPELATGGADANWQSTCDNTWLTAAQISDWSAVKSFKVLAYQTVASRWLPAEQIILSAPMLAPIDAPDSSKDPLDLSIAWNSIAHREFKINADDTTARLLAAEPLKVGIIVPFPGVSVGDYVWLDSNRDGYQSAGEKPIAGVKVELKDASGAVVQTTTTDALGYYSFQYLDAGKEYTIIFTAPTDMTFTTPDKLGTTNDPIDDNGSTPLNGTTGGDSDAIPSADGLTGSVTFTTPTDGNNLVSDPAAGTIADNPGLDAGFVPNTVPVSIGDYVWYDNNRNGLQDDNDPYVGMTVNLLDAQGAPVLDSAGNPRTTTTDANGYYSFTDLVGGATYVVEFVKKTDESFTTKDVTVNPDDAKDSDADLVTGRVTVVAKADGANKPSNGVDVWADDPTIDAGIVRYNLLLDKVLTTAGPYRPGQTVTYTLTPSNAGPSTAVAGWSVTDVLPAGLTLVSMSGTDYDCTTTVGTCVSSTALAGGTAGAPVLGNVITVTATIGTTATGSLKNVAYVSPSANDGPETIPLVTPTLTTDTTQPNTDNDDEQSLTLLPYVSVGDFVWYDVNRDGQQTAGEPVYVGMTVELYAADGTTKLNSTTTDAGGYYSFTGLDPSTAYVIKFVKKVDETFTTTNQGGITTNSPTGDLTDSDAAQADGTVAFTTTATGSNLASSVTAGVKADNPGIDAGIIRYNLVLDKALTSSGPYYEGGTVTYSLTPSNDGLVDALKGWSVTDILPAGLTLVSMTGTGYDCTTTLGTCVSTDAGLAAGQKGNVITVTATIDANVTGDLKNVAYVDKAANDEPETNPLGDKPTVATETGQTPTDNDDQEKITVLSKVSIGDYVWLDVNRDGLQAGEAGIAGVTVTLTDAAGATRSTTTDGTGYYWFDDLTPGAAYTLTFTKPTGYVWTTQNVAGDTADKDGGTDSDVNPADGKVSFTAPTSGSNGIGALVTDNPTLDAGLIELVSVGDYTWLDVNRNGVQDAGESPLAGVTVNLYDAAGALVGTKTTDAAGYYWFTDLLAGATYTIEFVKPAGYTYTPVVNADPTANKDGGLDSDAPVTDGKVTFTAEATGSNAAGATATDNPTIDAGFVELVSIGDYVWYDRNRDGLQGAVADEPVVAGVVVNLYAADGTTLVKTTTTDAAGFYSFTDLLAGATYVVEFVKPADTVFTVQDVTVSPDDAKDSDADAATGRVTVVAPSTGANSATTPDDPSIDAGLVELVSVGNYVWLDVNRDGLQSEGEPVVAGVTVNLLDAEGNPAVLPGDAPVTTVTDESGYYAFNNLIGGVTYWIEFVTPEGKVLTFQDVEGDTSNSIETDVADSDADQVTGLVEFVAPVTGDNLIDPMLVDNPTIDAGLVTLVSVGDYVWYDVDRDGAGGSRLHGDVDLCRHQHRKHAADRYGRRRQDRRRRDDQLRTGHGERRRHRAERFGHLHGDGNRDLGAIREHGHRDRHRAVDVCRERNRRAWRRGHRH